MDYQARDAENQELENEYYAGDIQDEEYFRRRWSEAEMWPEGGRVAEPRTEGPSSAPRESICLTDAGLDEVGGAWRPTQPVTLIADTVN